MIVAGSLTTGELMSLLTYCMNIMMSLMMLSMVFVMLAMSIASAERICEVLNEKSDITNPENPVYEVADGSVTFDHVTFRYNKTSDKRSLMMSIFHPLRGNDRCHRRHGKFEILARQLNQPSL